MAKAKNPLLSLDAHGSLASAITYQSRNIGTIVRHKPIPKQPNTLAQWYQRWKYQYEIAQWHLLTPAEQRQWQSDAVRYHMSGFAYYMRQNLPETHNLHTWFRLDEPSGSSCANTASPSHPGTAFGTVITPVAIGNGRFFDGIDDYVVSPYPAHYDLTGDFTLSIFCNLISNLAVGGLMWHGFTNFRGYCFYVQTLGRLWFRTFQAAALQQTWSVNNGVIVGELHRYTAVLESGTCTLYRDDIDITSIQGVHLDPAPAVDPLYIGKQRLLIDQIHAYLDDPMIFERALTQAQVKLYSERRYPL